MTKSSLLPVRFAIFNLLKFGKRKGQVDERSYHTVELWRDPRKESVADTIKRLKLMYSITHVEGEGTKWERTVIDEPMSQRFRILTAEESDAEREQRRIDNGLTVVNNEEPTLIEANDPVVEQALASAGL